ncbi:MAG: ATP-binding protein [Actinomycetota bacterium]|nr:ATP-binding protein [Actinomycetota bacterium]
MKRSLRRVLITRYTLITAFLLVAVALLVVIPIRSFTLSREEDTLKEQAELFARIFQPYFDPLGDLEMEEEDFDAYLESLASDLPARLTVIDASGRVLGDSDFPAEEMENHAGRPEVASALQGRTASARRESRTLRRDFIYAAAPVHVEGRVVGVTRVALEEEDVSPAVFGVWWIILAAFGALLMVVVAASLWTERSLTGELAAMREAASGLASGDLSRRVAEPGIEEFDALAKDFNAMADQVRRWIEEARSERGRLEALIDNISAGIMVTDSEARIAMLNHAAEEVMGLGGVEVEGRRVIEVFSSRELDIIISRAVEGEVVDEEIELLYPRRVNLRVKANPVKGSDEKVVSTVSVIEDVTELSRLNRMRQDFVANVSHELRTPVATIRALADSLQGGALDDRERAERFLRDLGHEAARLSQLVEDLLTLSRLEARETSLQLEDFEPVGLVRDCLEDKGKMAERFGVRLELGEAGEELALVADRGLLRTAINNLLDNAIKYNRPGGRVRVSVREGDGASALIEVEDTGIGIKREELPRVFERFYRVDRARSRETGGTGLGLSIVRHIVDLHGGTVEVRSAEGEGSTFTIRLPKWGRTFDVIAPGFEH